MNQLHAFLGAANYEFRMQIRRLPMWITFLCTAVLMVFLSTETFTVVAPGEVWSPVKSYANWASSVNALLPLLVGFFLADRLPRDRRTHVDELLDVLPGNLGIRLCGKYLGSTQAILIPMLIIYSIGIGELIYNRHYDLLQALPMSLAIFATVVLPGTLFVAAFSIACPAILWVPLYQFLFIGYWFWGNLLPPGFNIPTLSATILTPVGSYMAVGFYGIQDRIVTHSTILQGIESMLLLLGLAAFVMFVLWAYLKWQQARQ